ncbi:MAG: ECF transporter S component [Candidatus Bathyarchaeota archaeon]|nr:ECF transporter S component [Candidatus Bathyarchaeota archaeon]
MESKALVFAAMMAALGNVLSFLSMQLAPLAPNIPLGPVQVSLALDLSHLTTFIAALFGGPVIGGMTGLIGGLVAAFEFGFSKGNLVTGFGLPLGKAMTGVTAGYVFKALYTEGNNPRLVATTVISYIPEAILTYALFKYLLPAYTGMPAFIAVAIAVQIIVKAFVEMVILGVILIGMVNNLGFKTYARGYFN